VIRQVKRLIYLGNAFQILDLGCGAGPFGGFGDSKMFFVSRLVTGDFPTRIEFARIVPRRIR
jgi:hypothetical protein